MILSAKRKGREEEDPKTLTDILIEQMRSIERQDGVQEDEAAKNIRESDHLFEQLVRR